jgi:hypothetical protein
MMWIWLTEVRSRRSEDRRTEVRSRRAEGRDYTEQTIEVSEKALFGKKLLGGHEAKRGGFT